MSKNNAFGKFVLFCAAVGAAAAGAYYYLSKREEEIADSFDDDDFDDFDDFDEDEDTGSDSKFGSRKYVDITKSAQDSDSEEAKEDPKEEPKTEAEAEVKEDPEESEEFLEEVKQGRQRRNPREDRKGWCRGRCHSAGGTKRLEPGEGEEAEEARPYHRLSQRRGAQSDTEPLWTL